MELLLAKILASAPLSLPLNPQNTLWGPRFTPYLSQFWAGSGPTNGTAFSESIHSNMYHHAMTVEPLPTKLLASENPPRLEKPPYILWGGVFTPYLIQFWTDSGHTKDIQSYRIIFANFYVQQSQDPTTTPWY